MHSERIGRLVTLDQMNDQNRIGKTILNSLGIQYTKLGDNFLEATMPVDDRTCQPYGILYGGASVETNGNGQRSPLTLYMIFPDIMI